MTTINAINHRFNSMNDADLDKLNEKISALPENVFDAVSALDDEYSYNYELTAAESRAIRAEMDRLLKPYGLKSMDWFVWDCD
jgi:hypothetical protein